MEATLTFFSFSLDFSEYVVLTLVLVCISTYSNLNYRNDSCFVFKFIWFIVSFSMNWKNFKKHVPESQYSFLSEFLFRNNVIIIILIGYLIDKNVKYY